MAWQDSRNLREYAFVSDETRLMLLSLLKGVLTSDPIRIGEVGYEVKQTAATLAERLRDATMRLNKQEDSEHERRQRMVQELQDREDELKEYKKKKREMTNAIDELREKVRIVVSVAEDTKESGNAHLDLEKFTTFMIQRMPAYGQNKGATPGPAKAIRRG